MKKAFLGLTLMLVILLLCPLAAHAKSDPGKNIFDVSEGQVRVEKVSAQTNRVFYGKGQKDVPVDAELTVIGKSIAGGLIREGKPKMNVIFVASGVTAHIRLSGVEITPSDGGLIGTFRFPAFGISDGATVYVTLADGTTNKLVGASGCAGIEVSRTSASEFGTLVITDSGSGMLNAQGGSICPGIGGAYGKQSGNIIINGGTVSAKGGNNGAGIGGGREKDGGNITINGGTVSATGGFRGAGIGGGEAGDGGNITINGGKVTAATWSNSGIGGGVDGGAGNIVVNGGTIHTWILGENGKTSGSVTITGGSVDARNMAPAPKNAAGKPVYKVTMTTEGADETVSNISPAYGLKGAKSDDKKKLTFYLPENLGSSYSSLTYNDSTYKARVNREGTEYFSKETPIDIDTENQITRYYSANRGFRVFSTPAGLKGFTVEYKKHGQSASAYATELPIDAGIYDVRVTRPRDAQFAAFKTEIESGLELLDSFTYTVSYNGNGATGGAMSSSKHTHGFEKTLNANAFTKTSHAFAGWDTNAAGASVVYTDRQAVLNLTDKDGGNVDLYAVWTLVTYDVTYNPGRYGAGGAQTDKKTGEVPLALRSAIFTREGYAQTGWATTDGGEKAYELGAEYAADAPILLYPVWTKVPVVIIGKDERVTPCESLSQALELAQADDTIRLTENCTQDGDVSLPKGIAFDLGGYALVCGKLTVPSRSSVIIREGQSVEISPNAGASAAPSRIAGLKNTGEVECSGQLTLTDAVIDGLGPITVKAGGITLKGASFVRKIKLARGVVIQIDASFTPSSVIGGIYLPENCYEDGYQVLTGSGELDSCFTLGNAPDNNWYIDEDGRLFLGASGFAPLPVLVPEHMVIGKGKSVNVNNLLPYGTKGATHWRSGDENILKIVQKKGKQLLSGVSEGETMLSMVLGDKVVETIPVLVVPKEQAVKKVKGAGAITLRPGETKALSLAVKPEDALDPTLFYYVSKSGVAQVTGGVVKGIGKGVCRVTAVSTSGERKVIKVTVKKFAKLESAALNETALTLKVGEKATLTVSITPEEADQKVTWSSKNPKIASVKGGVVTAKKPGTATIVCKPAGGEKLVCEVTVSE